MRAHVTYTEDGTIRSIGLGDGLLADAEDGPSGDFELPAGFPDLSGPDAEQAASRALAALSVDPTSRRLVTRA
ncbi:hypothetical protein [uncultured Cellulomonas sp.]|uniref:hypothetical protein n=1 Tax=uncultured Cellulomonas sp. TaxID=189682 RepID=UPI0028EC3CE8|nr:hypothetical protein [uncultured Cellulomonas sp.]